MSDERAPDRTGTSLLAALLGPPLGPYLGCDECFEMLDEYVEHLLAGAPAADRIPGMQAHLAGCPACQEEHDTLLALAAGD